MMASVKNEVTYVLLLLPQLCMELEGKRDAKIAIAIAIAHHE